MSHRELIEICTAIKDLANLDAAPIREKLKKRAEMILDQMGGVKTDVSVFRLAEHAYETFFRGKLHQPALADAPQATRDGWVNAAAQIIAVYTGVKPDILDPRPVPDLNKHLCSAEVENDVTDLPMLKGVYTAIKGITDPAVFNSVSVEAALRRYADVEDIKIGKITKVLRAVLQASAADNIFLSIQKIGKDKTLRWLDEAIKNGW